MSLRGFFSGTRKKENSTSHNNNHTADAQQLMQRIDAANRSYFKSGDRAIINSLSSKMVFVLRMIYIAYKNNGTVTTVTANKTPTYSEHKEFEDLIRALGNKQTIDGSKTYLQLAQEYLCPPCNFGKDETVVFEFANDLLKNNTADYQAFEDLISKRLSESSKKNTAVLHPQKEAIEYTCPYSGVTSQSLEAYKKAVEQTLVNTGIDSGVCCWFRSYKELTKVAFEYASKLFDGGDAVMKLAKSSGKSIDVAFAALCGFSLHAGLVAAKEYCANSGSVTTARAVISMTNNEVSERAARILGYQTANDPTFTIMLSVFSKSCSEIIGKNRSNRDMFIKGMLITLMTAFEFGTGLYYEF